MEIKPTTPLQKWLKGQSDVTFEFEDQWKLVLLRMGDHVTDQVDEDGARIQRSGPYFFDLAKLCAADSIPFNESDLKAVATHLATHRWINLKPDSVLASLTSDGFEKAREINDEVFNSPSTDEFSWSFGSDEPLHDWLLVHGYRAFDLGEPYSEDGMVNFLKVVSEHPRKIDDKELSNALADLEFKDMIMCDKGPTTDGDWAYFNQGGIVAAELLLKIWRMRNQVPAADRFVRLDDNAPVYDEALAALERLFEEAKEIRTNDWKGRHACRAEVGSRHDKNQVC